MKRDSLAGTPTDKDEDERLAWEKTRKAPKPGDKGGRPTPKRPRPTGSKSPFSVPVGEGHVDDTR